MSTETAAAPPQLYDFQREDVEWITTMFEDHSICLLASEMGTGKTAQSIAAARKMGCKDVLVLCPASVRTVWRDELPRWWPEDPPDCNLPETIDPGTPAPGWNVLTAPTFANDKHQAFREHQWDLVVVDEAHLGGFKAFHPQRHRSSRAGWEFYRRGGIADHADRILLLTGTPMPNYPIELWPMASRMMPRNPWCADRGRFLARFCAGDEAGRSNLPELRSLLHPFMLRRMKRDVLSELPPKTMRIVELPATEEIQMALAEDGESVELAKSSIESIRERMADAKEIGSMREFRRAQGELKEAKAIAHERLVAMRAALSVPKIPLVAEYARLLLAEGLEKVVIFGWHTAFIEGLRDELADLGVSVIYGKTPTGKGRRGRIVEEFQTGSNRVFIGQIKSAGSGITLTAATDCIFGEVDWVPGNIAQAAARTHRPGQDKPVTLHLLAVEKSPDSVVLRSVIRKLETISAVLSGSGRKASQWVGRDMRPDQLVEPLRGNLGLSTWIHRQARRLVRLSDSGYAGDGVGFSAALLPKARKLAARNSPSWEDLAELTLLVARFHPQLEESAEKTELLRILGAPE